MAARARTPRRMISSRSSCGQRVELRNGQLSSDIRRFLYLLKAVQLSVLRKSVGAADHVHRPARQRIPRRSPKVRGRDSTALRCTLIHAAARVPFHAVDRYAGQLAALRVLAQRLAHLGRVCPSRPADRPSPGTEDRMPGRIPSSALSCASAAPQSRPAARSG